MFDDLVTVNDQVRIRTTVGSDVLGQLTAVDNCKRLFIVKAGDCEGSYHVPFDAVLCIRVDHFQQQPLLAS